MKKIYILMSLFLLVFASCDTEQDVIDTGVSSPYYEGNMMDYLRSDDFNWDLTVQMIERGGLTDLFEGNDTNYPEITFFGVKSYTILRHLYSLGSEEGDITILTEQECRDFILMHVVDGKYLKEDIEYRDLEYLIHEPEQTGYTDLQTIGGNTIRAYLERGDYGGVQQAGATTMKIYSASKGVHIPLATPDIQPDNGVVHALNYDYVLGNL